MTVDPRLDHLILAAPDVDQLAEEFAALAGVTPVLGGRHPLARTRNYLVGLGGAWYLELIGPDDPSSPDGPPDHFAIGTLTGPRLSAWVVRPDDIDATVAAARAAGYDPGDVRDRHRVKPDGSLLEWRLTPNRGDRFGGIGPALIDWRDSVHPTAGDLPQLGLVSLSATHPDPGVPQKALAALDVHLDVTPGTPAGLVAVLDTPRGRITLH